MNESYFDGGLLGLIGIRISAYLIVLFSFGILTPWAITLNESWMAKHTVIEGKRLVFVGSASDLFLQWLLWLFLTIITLGIYAFWLTIKMKQWVVKNTRFAN